MAKNEAKIKFTAETGAFNDAIKKSNNEMSRLRAEMRLNNTQMKTTGATIEALENKHRILSSQLSASENKTAALSQKLNKAAEIFGDNSDKVSRLKTQLLNAQNAEEALRQAVNACEKEITEQRNASLRAETATGQLTSKISDQQSALDRMKRDYIEATLKYGEASDEAKKLGQSISQLSGDIKQNQAALSSASDKADEFDKSLDSAGDSASSSSGGFTVMKGAIADLVSSGIQAGIGKIQEFTSYLAELPGATLELRQDLSTLTTSFDTMGFSTGAAKNTWKELYAVFGEDDRAVETANNISKMANNQKELNDWIDITTGVWGTYQDSLPVEGLAEASMETARTGTVTGRLADALNWSSEAADMFSKYMGEDCTTAEDAFNKALSECSNEQERQQLITDTLTALYGDAADTYRETSKTQMDAKKATAENMEAEADLAAAVEPVTTEFTNLKTELMEGATPAVEEASATLTDAIGWMKGHPTVIKAVGASVGVLAAGFTGLAVALGIYAAAQWIANAAIAPFIVPAMVVIGIMAVLVGAGIALYENWDKIKEKASEVWQGVKEKWNDLKNATVEKFTEMKEKASEKFEDLKKKVSDKASNIKTKVSTHWNNLKEKTSTAYTNIKEKASTKFSELKTSVVSHASNIKTKVSTYWNDLKKKTSDKFNSIKNTISEKMDSAKKGVSNAIRKIKGYFNFNWSLPKIKLPHFKLTGSFSLKNMTVPHISVEWYKNGGILTKPTVFGMNGNNLMAGGEAGPEAVLPISLLQDYINRAFENNINTYAIEGGGGDVYNFYVNDATINDNEEMRSVAKSFITELVRLGGMNR